MERRIPIFALVVALSVLGLGAGAAQAQPDSQVLAPATPQAQMSEACALTQEQCTVDCMGRKDRASMVSCLMGCDNSATLCARDAQPTLSSEWYAEQLGNVIGLKAGACHATTPCPPEYGSCAAWSGYSDCGDPWCGVYGHCGSGCGEPLCFDDATRQSKERYRVCLNQQAQACTEYQRISTVVGCGC
jgi:hypothetical protein